MVQGLEGLKVFVRTCCALVRRPSFEARARSLVVCQVRIPYGVVCNVQSRRSTTSNWQETVLVHVCVCAHVCDIFDIAQLPLFIKTSSCALGNGGMDLGS